MRKYDIMFKVYIIIMASIVFALLMELITI